MGILETLEKVGVTRVDRTSRLVSPAGVGVAAFHPGRMASWAPASEPPRLPFFYARMMQLDF